MATDGLRTSTTLQPATADPGAAAASEPRPSSPDGEVPPARGEPRPARRRRHRWAPTRVLSATGSLIVHGLLLLALAAIVWRTTSLTTTPGRDVSISFEAPAMGDAPEPTPGRTDQPPASPRSREIIINLDPPPLADATPPPIAAPALPSLATQPLTSAGPSRADLAPGSLSFAPDRGGGAAGAPVATAASGAAGAPGGVTFAGLGASNARTVVYVVDGSGSMVTSLPFVIAEVERSVMQLAATQKFGVVIFRRLPDGRDGVEVFAPVLVRATSSAIERLRLWLPSVEPAGRSVPILGLERALAYRPDVVFLLSRAIERSGGGADTSEPGSTAGAPAAARGLADTLARIDALNPVVGEHRATVIQTIQFLDDDPTGIMQEIGRVHGSRADASGREIPGYRVIRRGEDLGAGAGSAESGGSGGEQR